MSYTQTNWLDRSVQYPNRFTQTTNADGTITLTPSPGTVTQAGTPITAATLNNIETGIANASVTASGSNANGSYIQYSNGLQICWFYDSKTNPSWTWTVNASQGYNYWYINGNWTYPAAFASSKAGYTAVFASGYIGGFFATKLNTLSDNGNGTSAGYEHGVDAANNPAGYSGYTTRYYLSIGYWK